MSVEVRVDAGRIARLLRARGGIVERNLRRRTARVAAIAERRAPGTMGSYVTWTVETGPRGLQGVVRCDHPAVRFVHEGTRPHIIRARRARALRFTMGGRPTYAKYVRHPGTRANPFLTDALREGR